MQELGNNAIGIRADAANLSDTEKIAEQVKSKFGKVDVLFVNAGVALQEPIGQITEEAFDTMMNTNFKGAVFTTEEYTIDGGSSINACGIPKTP